MPRPALIVLAFAALDLASARASVAFDKQVLNAQFFSEGACYADFNDDGHQDIASGPLWYEGPDFKTRHAFDEPLRFRIKQYSRFFFTFAHDFNGDGRIDILGIPMPGTTAHWYENPGKTGVMWKKHVALDDVGNESPHLTDLTGDGKPELICCRGGKIGFAVPDPAGPWKFTAITDPRGYGRFTHGLGIGDVNGDGLLDVLETNGWWEQPAKTHAVFRFHPVKFAEAGGAQMFAYDFDGDGDNDVVSSQNAHAWGLAWFEQREPGKFVRHNIMTQNPKDNSYGVAFSQMHAVALADVDGDGVKDVITGKRFYAHGGGDPGAHELPVLYWFRTVRTPGGVVFEPNLIDQRSGVGTQLTAGDVTGDGRVDVVVGNKMGTYVFKQRKTKGEPPRVAPARAAGTNLFASHVRTTDPLTPEEEHKTFVLPEGFEIQLVAAEPEIAKPMNLAFDKRGRLWVSSSEEYPYAAPKDRKAKDTIKILEDTNGDGRADKITTFADNLNIPIGLYPYRDGVIAFSIPNIWFLRDTDGDGRCDKREVLYGPFGYEKDTHGMCNAFTHGLDGWLYACHGFNNTSKVAGKDGHAIEMHSGNIFRMKLDGSRLEVFTRGQVNPFGMAFAPNGDLFTADCHTKPISLLVKGGYHQSFGKPHDGLGFIPNVMEHMHGSTAICGIAFGADTAFPGEYADSVLSGNVTTCRINRNTIVHHGSTPRAEEEPDFLVSGDPWFRPVDLQVGPDGALYVADFYNRIIGHYEVPLEHPGRDRKRGRIWRIVHRDAKKRVDADRSKIEALWRDADSVANLKAATADASPQVREHAFRTIAAKPKGDFGAVIVNGLEDPAPLVKRAAVMAAAEHVADSLVDPLLKLLRNCPKEDTQLAYAARLALRNHLRDPARFAKVAGSEIAPAEFPAFARLCLSLKTPAAADFLVRNLDRLENVDPNELGSWLEFAAQHGNPELFAGIADTVQKRFAGNLDFQRSLLQSIRHGLRQRGMKIPEPITSWASSLALRLLGVDDKTAPLSWSYQPHPDAPQPKNAWVLSTKRKSSDGMKATPLWSSFPLGEQRTGIFRSEPFELGEKFSFYLAGHDGHPPKPIQKKNWVRLRDAVSNEILKETNPPRNDTAQKIEWDTSKWTGKQAVVELVDGDTDGAFAWLAVGRFSVPGLNPSRLAEDRRMAAELVTDFLLKDLREPVSQVLKQASPHSETASLLARSIAALNGGPMFGALAQVLSIRGASAEVRRQAVDALVSKSENPEVLAAAMKSATAAEQKILAEKLIGNANGAEIIIKFVEASIASAQLLKLPNLGSVANASQKTRIAALTKDLADENAALAKLIESRIKSCLAGGGNASAGAELFRTQCMICHQVGGEGKALAPNLDGIGNRGLERLVEDILDPNRNVDHAFRITTVIRKDDSAVTGFVRSEEGAQIVLVDAAGNEHPVPKADVKRRIPSTISLMPPTFGQTLTETQLTDLMAWLLSLRS